MEAETARTKYKEYTIQMKDISANNSLNEKEKATSIHQIATKAKELNSLATQYEQMNREIKNNKSKVESAY